MADSKRGEGFDALMQTSTLRALAADARFDSMPAKFRWAYQWAADEIDRIRSASLTDDEQEAVNYAANVIAGRPECAVLLGLYERLR